MGTEHSDVDRIVQGQLMFDTGPGWFSSIRDLRDIASQQSLLQPSSLSHKSMGSS